MSNNMTLYFLLMGVCLLRFGAGQGASNIESSVAGSSATSSETAAAPAPVVAAPPPVAPVTPVVSPPIVPPVAVAPAAGASDASSSAAATSTGTAAASPVVSTPVVVPPAPAVVVTDQHVTGFTTEHKSPDGSIITITKFNGQIPPNAFPGTQIFNAFNHPLFAGNPLYPGWGSAAAAGAGVGRVIRGKRASSSSETGSNKKDEKLIPVVGFRKALKEHPRVSEKFHYPSPPPDYFTTYKRPFVPIVDNEFSDLI